MASSMSHPQAIGPCLGPPCLSLLATHRYPHTHTHSGSCWSPPPDFRVCTKQAYEQYAVVFATRAPVDQRDEIVQQFRSLVAGQTRALDGRTVSSFTQRLFALRKGVKEWV